MGFRLLKIMLTAEVILLFIQFWLGMSINLYVNVPLLTPFNYFMYAGGTEVLAHILNGLSVLVLAGFILSYSYRLTKSISLIGVIGLVFAAIAPIVGYNFVLQAQNNDLSMAMAMSFIITFSSYLAMFSRMQKPALISKT